MLFEVFSMFFCLAFVLVCAAISNNRKNTITGEAGTTHNTPTPTLQKEPPATMDTLDAEDFRPAWVKVHGT